MLQSFCSETLNAAPEEKAREQIDVMPVASGWVPKAFTGGLVS